MCDQPITACYYHVIEKTNSATASMHTCCFACVDALIMRKKKQKKGEMRWFLSHLAWLEL